MTCYCDKISRLSFNLWNYLNRVFYYQLPAAEIGITNHLIYDITEYYSGFGILCEVYKLHAKREKTRGADIDLFIQNSSGTYQHYMIQAKVMDYRGYYKDISKWKPSAQFVTLIKVAKKENALPLYLLYNGKTKKSSLGNSHLGLSIIEAKEISKFRYNQKRKGYIHGQNFLYFDLLHPFMQPYSNLFCKNLLNIDLPPSKDYGEIFKGWPYIKVSPIDDRESDNDLEDNENFENEKNIINANHLAPFRIILKLGAIDNQEL